MNCVSVSLAIGILRSVRRRLPPPPQPHRGHAAGGAGSRGAPRARNGHTTALFACERQSFLDNVIAGLRQTGAWNDPRGADFRAQIAGEPRDSEKRAQFRKRSSRSRHAVSSAQGSRGPTH